MPNKFSTGTCMMALGFVIASAPAYAGFQWVAPSDGGTYQPPAQGNYLPAPAPAASNAPEIISPVVITGDSNSRPSLQSQDSYAAAPAPMRGAPPQTLRLSPSSTPSIASQPPIVQPAPNVASASAMPTDLSSATVSMSSSGGQIVQGFGSQIPLAIALRQILPSGYNFSIDQDVDMNTLVSYKGGKPWRDTLRDALAPAGLVMADKGSSVTISHTGDASSSAPYAPSSAPISISSNDTPAALPSQNVAQSGYLMAPSQGGAPAMADSWSAQRGDTLRKVLEDWCQRANVELQWQAEYDYPIEASAHFSNGFEDAVRNLLAGFDGARPQPIGQLHTNTAAGQMVLVVQARGNSYTN